MLCYQKCKVGILSLLVSAFVAVSVNSDDSVSVFINDYTVRVHTEGAYVVLKLLRTVYDLALIEFIGKMRKDDCRKFNSDTYVNSVALGRNAKILTDRFHPLASATAYRNDTLITGKVPSFKKDFKSPVFHSLDLFDRSHEAEIDSLL